MFPKELSRERGELIVAVAFQATDPFEITIYVATATCESQLSLSRQQRWLKPNRGLKSTSTISSSLRDFAQELRNRLHHRPRWILTLLRSVRHFVTLLKKREIGTRFSRVKCFPRN